MKKPKDKTLNKVGYGTVSLPTPLLEKIKKRMVGTGMPSVSAYVAFVLREVLLSSDEKRGVLLKKRERKEIQERLRRLGY